MITKRNKKSEFIKTGKFLRGKVFLPVGSRRIFRKIKCTAAFMFCILASFAQKQKLASLHIVKVAVVMQDPRIPSMGNKRIHELFKTPGYTFQWNDPWKLAEQYRDSLNAISHGVVKYEFVKIYDENIFFTKLKNSTELLSLDKLVSLLSEPGWATLKKDGTQFDYNAFIQHYGFCEMRDRNEINEVWLWSFPYA